jgi:hypothetical protein
MRNPEQIAPQATEPAQQITHYELRITVVSHSNSFLFTLAQLRGYVILHDSADAASNKAVYARRRTYFVSMNIWFE